jgi:tripartite-type tricarboxylate transporter receptor subunit TctC
MIDNRPGASGIIGAEVAARASPDGYTLLMVYPSHPVNSTLKKQLPYDTLGDFTGVTTLTTAPLVVLVPPSLPVKNLQELIALAKKDRVTFAPVGAGSLAQDVRQHLPDEGRCARCLTAPSARRRIARPS